MNSREYLKDKKRIVIKIGSSSITHEETGNINYEKLEKLTQIVSDLLSQKKEVILVSSGAIAVGRYVMGIDKRPSNTSMKQALAAIGQARLMTTYQKLFSEHNQVAAQILMTKNTIMNDLNRFNAANTFNELMAMGAVPIVNENDTVSTYEMNYVNDFGDNDRLSAVVAALVSADLLILLSDIDGLYTDDPKKNKNAEFISEVSEITKELMAMGKDTAGNVGTGGMSTKLAAANIATKTGTDMIIANAEDFSIIRDIMNGKEVGTLFTAHSDKNFYLIDYLMKN
jgi:glutamate 5-kinase